MHKAIVWHSAEIPKLNQIYKKKENNLSGSPFQGKWYKWIPKTRILEMSKEY